MHKQKITSRFNTTQWKELIEHQNNEDIMAKGADKGSVVIVMDTLDYRNLYA